MITTTEISDDHHFLIRGISGLGDCVVVVVVPSGLGDADGGGGV
jgi:hypothetical protein